MQLVTNLNDAADMRASVEFLKSRLGPASTSTTATATESVAPALPPGVPSAPAIPAAPAAPTEAVTARVSSNENMRDNDGIPWDERIHSSSKTLTDKGFWKKRKGTADATFTAVRQQLLAAGAGVPATATQMPASVVPPPPAAAAAAAPAAPAAPTPPPVVVAPPPPPVVVVPPSFPPEGWQYHPSDPAYCWNPATNEVVENEVLRARSGGAPAAPAAAVAANIPDAVDWNMTCNLMNEKLTSGKVTADNLKTIGDKIGVTPFAMLITRPDKYREAFIELSAYA